MSPFLLPEKNNNTYKKKTKTKKTKQNKNQNAKYNIINSMKGILKYYFFYSNKEKYCKVTFSID